MSLSADAGRDPDVPWAEATGAHLMGAGEAPLICMPVGKLVPTGGGRQQAAVPVEQGAARQERACQQMGQGVKGICLGPRVSAPKTPSGICHT